MQRVFPDRTERWRFLAGTSEGAALLKFTNRPILLSNCIFGIVTIINEKYNSVMDGLEIQFSGPNDDFALLEQVIKKSTINRTGLDHFRAD